MDRRQIVLDTETTGLEVNQGHRIIEIGCVELINRRMIVCIEFRVKRLERFQKMRHYLLPYLFIFLSFLKSRQDMVFPDFTF